MIDRDFFEDLLRTQVREMEGQITGEVHTHSGERFQIARIAHVADGYVLIEVYPEEGGWKLPERRGGDDANLSVYVYDRVVVPFGSIRHVRLTRRPADVPPGEPAGETTGERRRIIGFAPQE
jgi:hypothetical protein